MLTKCSFPSAVASAVEFAITMMWSKCRLSAFKFMSRQRWRSQPRFPHQIGRIAAKMPVKSPLGSLGFPNHCLVLGGCGEVAFHLTVSSTGNDPETLKCVLEPAIAENSTVPYSLFIYYYCYCYFSAAALLESVETCESARKWLP